MIILKDKNIEALAPEPVVAVLQGWLCQLDNIERRKEHFFVLLLDAGQRVTLTDVVSVGTLNSSLVHPREVFIRTIREGASALIIAHNHLSGACEPSEADIAITRRLREAGTLLGIEVLDHLILTTNSYYSFVEAGKL